VQRLEIQTQVERELMIQEEQLQSILRQNFLSLNLEAALRRSEDILNDKMKIISQLNDELNKLKSHKPPVGIEASTMTEIIGSYFDKQKDSIST
jgi:hypothetical protein